MRLLSQTEKNCSEFDDKKFEEMLLHFMNLTGNGELTRKHFAALVKHDQVPEPTKTFVKDFGETFEMSFSRILKLLDSAEKQCSDLQLTSALLYIPKVKESCTLSSYIANGASDLQQKLAQLKERMEDDLKGKIFLYLTIDRLKFFPHHSVFFPNNPKLFGEGVQNKFPGMTADIDDAGWCLATGRGTAAVYHLMCIMEVGIKFLANRVHLGAIQVEGRMWGEILGDINREINNLPHNRVATPAEKEFHERCSEAAIRLTHVKDAWRNATMHARRRYDLSEAESIFECVKSFANFLATKL